MAPEKARATAGRLAAAFAFATFAAAPAHALRLIDYNVLNYPGTTAATRNPLFRTILSPLAGDILVTEEQTSQSGVDQYLNNVLNVMEPGQWAAAPFIDGNDTDAALFYKPAKVQFLGQWGFYPNPANLLRLVHVYRVKPVGYSSGAAEIRLYALHLKASKGFEAQRLAEATGLRDSMNAVPPGTHCFALGDFNLYSGTSTEPALGKMLESEADNDGRCYDPLGLQGIAWQDNSAIAIYHTQSPCLSGGTACASGASTGGLDDRFDLFLPTLNFNSGTGLELVPGSYVSVGNDGLHLNLNITDAPTIPEGAAYADALIHASDHLPIRVDLSLPSELAAAASLDLGTVITGGGATLSVSNPATPPADGLTYSMAASSGFVAPAGTFDTPAGGSSPQTITTDAGPAGARAGTLTLTTDAPDAATWNVSLSANVLDHAAASLDSASVVTSGTLAFDHHAGQFTDLDARVHNFGWTSLQAKLDVASESLSGPDAGQFSVVNPGTAELSGVGQSYTVHFDDASATPDQVYNADLTIASSDEPLPGAQAQPNLVVHLSGVVRSGSTGVEGQALPQFSRLLAPAPNPTNTATDVRFDIAERGRARVAVFDLTGRRVALLVDRQLEPGHHSVLWRGTDVAGAKVGPGVYFVRMIGPRGQLSTERLGVVR